MRCLITGGRSSIGIDDLDNRNIESGVLAVRNALHMAAGWDVEVRVVTPGEDLTEYDYIVVEVPNPTMWSARHTAGAFHALSIRDDAVLYHTHLNPSLYKGLRKAIKKGDKFWEQERFIGLDEPEVRRMCVLTCASLAWGKGPWKSMTHAHRWGNHDLIDSLVPTPHDLFYDPSLLLPTVIRAGNSTWLTDDRRRKAWVHAAWEDHHKWRDSLNLTWEIVHFGRRSNGAVAKLTLPDLMDEYTMRWGAPHPYEALSGSGYFRSRYSHALSCDALLGIPEKDAQVMNASLFKQPAEIEKLDIYELGHLAESQKKWYWSNVESVDHATSKLVEFLGREGS